MLEQAQFEKKKRVTKIGEEIRKRYGMPNLSDEEILKIERVEKVLQDCQNCTGLDVCKLRNPGWQEYPKEEITVRSDGTEEKQLRFVMRMCEFKEVNHHQERINYQLKSARIPQRYQHLTFNDFIETPENEMALKFAKTAVKRGISLYCYGGIGTGKTMLTSIIANELSKQNKPVLFATVPELLADIRSSYGNKDEENRERIETAEAKLETIKNAPVLVLDDLGAERMSSWVAEQLFVIVNHRYSRKLQTIVTSNYPLESLSEHINKEKSEQTTGERIVDRIEQLCELIEIKGSSWRKKSRKK